MEFKKIQNIISQVLQLDISEITDDADLVSDLGADSLEIYQIILEIEKEFDISISNVTLNKDRTVGGLYQLILNQR
ncbi:MAG: acyl carrier protein [Eubacterium sp.]|nr:acyl carrier protein [Eubacterium sp.]